MSNKSKHLGKGILDVSWGMLIKMLKEKAEEYEREIVFVDRYFPSSQICSKCGTFGGKLPLHIRVW